MPSVPKEPAGQRANKTTNDVKNAKSAKSAKYANGMLVRDRNPQSHFAAPIACLHT
jgi:hypothetical protein